ncbi:Cna B-type domain-containing protein [Peptoniphilus equinus]|uniref:Cna B-type domain-containing protein n=1 Tax=Peptoniphilus equinus TaxID=3016343 RepID=A0ABY7QRF5_9FIRM|nr:Cna B-type domain-containing protein [Peptoniphilus equinus]WBW49369.1 Cna B-type domain-containing protein [Peptoniphilus equinus]
MKKKVLALVLAFLLVFTTMISGFNSVVVNANGNEETGVNQEDVIKTENDEDNNEDNKTAEEDMTADEKQSQYDNDVVTADNDKPLGLEEDTNDVLAPEAQKSTAQQDSIKIEIFHHIDDDMEGFAPKIELIDKANGDILFTIEKEDMPKIQENAVTTIDTGCYIEANRELNLKISDKVIPLQEYFDGDPIEITVDGQKYEILSLDMWYDYKDGQPSSIGGIRIVLRQIYKPEDQVLKVKKYWYDCNFRHEIDLASRSVTTGWSRKYDTTQQYSDNPKKLVIDYYGSEILIKGGRILTSSEIPVSTVKVRLYVDGKATDQLIELTENGGWEGEFDVSQWVDKNGNYSYYSEDDGFYHYYTLSLVEEGMQEHGESIYESQVNFLGKVYNVVSVVGDHQAYLFNYEAVCENPIDIPVEKIWKNENGEIESDSDKLPEKIDVVLMNGDKEVAKKELNKDNNWRDVFKDLPRYEKDKGEIKYTVKEESVKGYKSEISGDLNKGFVITNTKASPWTPMVPPTRDIHVDKVWVGSDSTTMEAPVESVDVALYADGEATGKTVTLSVANNWQGSFEDLQASKTLGGELITYTVKEDGATDDDDIQIKGTWYHVSIDGTMTDGFTITNTKVPSDPHDNPPTPHDNPPVPSDNPPTPHDNPPVPSDNPPIARDTFAISGHKIWDDENNKDGKRPDTITVRLLADGVEVDHQVVSDAEDWTWTFSGLETFNNGQAITYTVTEDPVDGYTAYVEGYNITNTLTPAVIYHLEKAIPKTGVEDTQRITPLLGLAVLFLLLKRSKHA